MGRSDGRGDAFRSPHADTAETQTQANASMATKLAFPKTSLFILLQLFVSLFAFAQMATVRVTLALGVVAPVFAAVGCAGVALGLGVEHARGSVELCDDRCAGPCFAANRQTWVTRLPREAIR